MKRSLIALISAAVAIVFGACNQHSWEDSEPGAKDGTNVLYEEHGHGADHKDGDHDKAEQHHPEVKPHPAEQDAAADGKKNGTAAHPEKVN